MRWGFAALLLIGCSFGGTAGDAPDRDPTFLTVSGQALDFGDRQPVPGLGGVVMEGLSSTTTEIDGANYVVSNVLENSAFYLETSASGYRDTLNPVLQIGLASLVDVDLLSVSDDFATDLETTYGRAPGSQILIAFIDDEAGAPFAGLPASVFAVREPLIGPFFLDDAGLPDADLMATSMSGVALFFSPPEGLLSLGAEPEQGFTLEMPNTPITDDPGRVTLVRVIAREGESPPLPVDVSFADDVRSIFADRGCTACHKKNQQGFEMGGFDLKRGGSIYTEVTEELSPNYLTTRVDLATPEASLVLTKPSLEVPTDGHPNSTFVSPSDPDYQALLVWISEGALEN